MIDAHFVILGAVLDGIGAGVYLRDTLRGVTKPNRVSWVLWAVSPLLAFGVELQSGVGLRALMTFVVGFFPLTIFLASFVNPRAVWRIRPIDYACGTLALTGLAVWLLARHGALAIGAFIAADGLAGIPTLYKSWRWPESETAVAYLLAAANAGITLLTVTRVTTAIVAFPIWILAAASLETVLVAGRLGPRLRAWWRSVSVDGMSRGATDGLGAE